MRGLAILLLAVSLSLPAMASEDVVPSVFYVYKTIKKNGQAELIAIPKGLLAMDTPYTTPLSNCVQAAAKVKVEGVQFSQGEATLARIHFVTSTGQRLTMPAGIEGLPNSAHREASRLIRVGRDYFVRYQLCGSGGFPSMIDLFEWDYVNGNY